jgi:hypothetical protein
VEANRDDLVARSSAPDDPTDRWCIASEQLCVRESQRLSDVGGAPDETTPWKSLASVHPTLTFFGGR